MVPAWATVVIALGAAAIGALAGIFGAYISLRIAQLNLRHQASEAWRTRQLEAAEDFSAAWTAAISHVGIVRAAVVDSVDTAAAFEALREKHADAGGKLMRVGLLFGVDSNAREFARKALSEANQATLGLEELSSRDRGAVTDAERTAAVGQCNDHLHSAQGAHRDFVRVAHSELRTAPADVSPS